MLRRNSHAIDELELMAYLDGELPRERAAAAAAHLETCRECQAIASDLRSVSQELAAWQVESADTTLSPNVSALLEVHTRTQEELPVGRRRSRFEVFRNRRIWAWGFVGVTIVMLLVAMSIPNLMR